MSDFDERMTHVGDFIDWVAHNAAYNGADGPLWVLLAFVWWVLLGAIRQLGKAWRNE